MKAESLQDPPQWGTDLVYRFRCHKRQTARRMPDLATIEPGLPRTEDNSQAAIPDNHNAPAPIAGTPAEAKPDRPGLSLPGVAPARTQSQSALPATRCKDWPAAVFADSATGSNLAADPATGPPAAITPAS
jgi:hypothetical protein